MRALVSSLILTALLVACGYKAPLFLPKPKPEAQRPAPAPAEERQKDSSLHELLSLPRT